MGLAVLLELTIGEDRFIDFTVTDADGTTPLDVSTWALSFMVKRALADLDADAIIHKTTAEGITVTGVFSATQSLNTQKVRVTLADDDLAEEDLADAPDQATAFGELKRTDEGAEAVLWPPVDASGRRTAGRMAIRVGVHRA